MKNDDPDKPSGFLLPMIFKEQIEELVEKKFAAAITSWWK